MKNFTTMSMRYDGHKFEIIDQQMLPDKKIWVSIESPQDIIAAIKALKVRGAPLIGISASLSLALWSSKAGDLESFITALEQVRESRPTAVNLMNNLDLIKAEAVKSGFNTERIQALAFQLFQDDVDLCKKMGRAGAGLVDVGDGILTHCNTGGLATAGDGTALSVLLESHRQDKNIHVYVDETRPLLQGGRLTAWELLEAQVPHSIICDNMAGWFMQLGKVQKIFVGADRIAKNGDFANKIGTYSLAVLADFHKIPFYVVAPSTTLDSNCIDGKGIPVEMRKDSEVRGVKGHFGEIRWAPEGSPVLNPAFDVTPSQLVTGFVIDGEVHKSLSL